VEVVDVDLDLAATLQAMEHDTPPARLELLVLVVVGTIDTDRAFGALEKPDLPTSPRSEVVGVLGSQTEPTT
jgi:hypothetical protein